MVHLQLAGVSKPKQLGIVGAIKCLDGWTKLGNKCYFIPKGKANQATAQGTCKKLGGVLVEPRDENENKYVFDFVAKHFGRDERFWMGINDKAKEGR